MITLQNKLYESLLDDEDDLVNDDGTILIDEFLKENYNIKGTYTINKNNEVDVNGDIKVKNDDLKYLTDNLFTFGTVTGRFECAGAGIISLKGGPKIVKKSFACNHCRELESLEGAPKEAGGFVCSNCSKIKNLKGAPEKVNGSFLCDECDMLESLEGAPKCVKGHFSCRICNNLKTLKGLPKEVGKNFYCDLCKKLDSAQLAYKVTKGNVYS